MFKKLLLFLAAGLLLWAAVRTLQERYRPLDLEEEEKEEEARHGP